ncbi:TPA: hypothetical protein ACH2I9_004172 [Enterobacter asburiae]
MSSKDNSKLKLKFETGLTLLEVALGLIIMAIVLVGITVYRSNVTEELKLRNNSKYLNVLADGFSAYLEYERNNILSAATSASTFPLVVDVPIQLLKDKLFLSGIVSNTFGNGRSVEFKTRVDRDASSPGGFSVQGIMLTKGGERYSVKELGMLSSMVKGLPGYVDNLNINVISGVNGSWQYNRNSWPGVSFEDGQLISLFSGDDSVSKGIGFNQRWQAVASSGVNDTDKTMMIIANADFIIPWFLKIGNAVGTPVGIFPGSFCLSINVGSNSNIGETCISNNLFDYKVTTKALVPPGESYTVRANKEFVFVGSPRVTQVFALK